MRLPLVFRGGRRSLFIRLIANGAGQAATQVAVALTVRLVFDRVADGSAGAGDDTFAWMMAGLLAATGATVVLRVIERNDAQRLGEDYVTRVRLRLFDALTGGPVMTLRRRGLGPTMLRFVTDLTAVRQWISNGLARLVVASLATAGSLIAIAVIDPLVGAVVAAITAATIVAGIALGRPLDARIRNVRKRRARLAAQIGDRLRALGVVQMSGQTGRERRTISRHSRGLAEAAVARARLASVVRVLPDAALGFSTVAILTIGGMRLADGAATPGTIIAALAVLGALSPQLRALGRVFEYWKNYQVATAKLTEVIAGAKRPRRNRREAAEVQEPRAGRLSFDNVSVKGALQGISATAEAGSLVAIAGPSGAGKSLLLAAAARLLRLNAGCVTLDGRDVATLNDAAFARAIAMVSPDLPLLKGSIRHNLTYRVENADDDAVAEAIGLCGLEDEIARLPGGLATRLGEEPSDLPLGLRRRLCLARAVLGGPAVLLLDDPDAGLDPAGRAALGRLLATRRFTVIMATHDIARARTADVLWTLDGGRLVETGDPANLLGGDSHAARFFHATGGAAMDDGCVTYLAGGRSPRAGA